MSTTDINPELAPLSAIERWTLILGALVLGGVLSCAGPRWQLGASLGVGMMVVNARLLRKQGQRLLPLLAGAESGARPPVSSVLWVCNPKLGALAALIYVCSVYLPVDSWALLLGVSILPAAIVCWALQSALSAAPAAAASGQNPSPYGES